MDQGENNETAKAWNSKRERERELVSKPTQNGLFAVQKLFIKYKNLKDGLRKKMYNSS